jgi:hypothetical protein
VLDQNAVKTTKGKTLTATKTMVRSKHGSSEQCVSRS